MSKRRERELHETLPDTGALLGEPVGERVGESMSRDEVDGLEFSAKQRHRPKGMSRAQYLDSSPGEDTQTLLVMAGLDRFTMRAKALTIIAFGLVLGAVGFVFVWWLAS